MLPTTLLAEVLRVHPSSIGEETTMAETEAWDSLSHLQLVATVEETYGVTFTMDDIVAITSVAGLRRVLAEKGV